MEQIVIFISSLVIIYLFYLLFVIRSNKKRERLYQGMEAIYLMKRYKISNKILTNKTYCHIIALTNSLIIALTVTIISLISNYLLMLLVGLILLIPQIFLYYHIVGVYYQKKEGTKNVKL